MTKLFKTIESWLVGADLPASVIKPLGTSVAVALTLALCGVFFWILAKPVSRIINRRIRDSKTDIDDILFPPKVVRAVCILATSLLLAALLPGLTHYYPNARTYMVIFCRVFSIGAVTYLLILETNAFCDFLRRGDEQRSGVLVLRNILQSVLGVGAALLIISAILNRDLAYVISALGAMAAVLMLVFKDSILGMIAGIRLSLNGMLKENDWVIVPKYNADGRVEDVSLTTVKVRNWDKSISTIPPHALMTEGFINKERMLDLGVRQIKRTFFIDVNSIRHLAPEETEKLAEEGWITGIEIAPDSVNLSAFRRWLRKKMQTHPKIAASSDNCPMQVLVRELPATPSGLPLEIFFFVNCLDWEEFEELQADFIDEITAAFPRFGLRLYQALAHPAHIPSRL